jgi:hypothetical protein
VVVPRRQDREARRLVLPLSTAEGLFKQLRAQALAVPGLPDALRELPDVVEEPHQGHPLHRVIPTGIGTPGWSSRYITAVIFLER